MIPVYQTLMGEGDGNCLQACLASILELPLNDVPHFCRDYSNEAWMDELVEWLGQFGLSAVPIQPVEGGDMKTILRWAKGYHIAGVKSPRGIMHAVVTLDGKIVHDPHPDQDSYDCEIEDIHLILNADSSSKSRKRLACGAMKTALRKAVTSAEHVIEVCEKDVENGQSPNPHVRSMPSASLAECYAAMAFVSEARSALELAEKYLGEG